MYIVYPTWAPQSEYHTSCGVLLNSFIRVAVNQLIMAVIAPLSFVGAAKMAKPHFESKILRLDSTAVGVSN